MGRTIKIDIDDMLALFRTYGSGGPTPSDLFDVIGDCGLNDIDEYARTRCEDYGCAKEEIIELYTGYMGRRMIAEMRELEGV
jgi:hypothetical protein